MENGMDLANLRIKIDQMNDKLLSLISTRMKYSLNEETFTKEFFDGKSWFLYRLKKEQDLDSEFGRFLYNDQLPFIFKKEELAKSKLSINNKQELVPVEIDLSEKIIDLYKKLLRGLCETKEDPQTYGETTKLDIEIILTINERTTAIGEHVSAYKLQSEPQLKNLPEEEIRKKLIKKEREVEVTENIITAAKKYGIENEKLMKEFAKDLIKITLDSEVTFILNS
jgi:chorismate mutase